MSFSNFFRGGFSEPRHIRRTRNYLQEARMAMLEHAIAAEHYHASADMYAERVRRLEEELAVWEAQQRGETYTPADAQGAPLPEMPIGTAGKSSKGGHHDAQPSMPAPASVGMARASA